MILRGYGCLGLCFMGPVAGCVSPPGWVPYCDSEQTELGFEEPSSLGFSAAEFLGLSLAEVNNDEMLLSQSDVTWDDGSQTVMLWGFAVDATKPPYWVHRFPAEPPKGVKGTALIELQCSDSIAVEGDLLLETEDGRLGEETFRGIQMQIQTSANGSAVVGDMRFEALTTDFIGTMDWDALTGDRPHDSRTVYVNSYVNEEGGYRGTLSLHLMNETEDTVTLTSVDVGSWRPPVGEES